MKSSEIKDIDQEALEGVAEIMTEKTANLKTKNPLKKERYISIGNIETGEVKRIIAEDLTEYQKIDTRLKKVIWFATAKGIWRRFKEENVDFLAGKKGAEMFPQVFTRSVMREDVSASDTIYDENPEGETVLVLVNVSSPSEKGYNRSDKRSWDGRTSNRSGNRKLSEGNKRFQQKAVVGDQFTEETIVLSELYDKVTLRSVKYVKGDEPVMVSKYGRDMINKINNQIRFGDYKKLKHGAILQRNMIDGVIISVIIAKSVPVKKIKVKQIRHKV